jgi:hypothetical protein
MLFELKFQEKLIQKKRGCLKSLKKAIVIAGLTRNLLIITCDFSGDTVSSTV